MSLATKMPIDVLVLDKNGDHEYEDTSQAAEPEVWDDGTVELGADLWGGRRVFLKFDLAELVRIALLAVRNESESE